MSVEGAIGAAGSIGSAAAIGSGVGSAIGASIGPSIEIGGVGSFGSTISSFSTTIETGLGTTFSPESLSGGMSKSIGMDEIMRTTVPLSVSVDSFNPDRIVPGEPRMVFDPRLFSIMAEPSLSSSKIASEPLEAVAPRSLLDASPSRRDLDNVEAPSGSDLAVQEAVADRKFTALMALQIAELFRGEPEAQNFWTTHVENIVEETDAKPEQNPEPVAVDIYAPKLSVLAPDMEPTMQVSPSTETEEAVASTTQIAVQADSSDENAAPPSNFVIENTAEPEEPETPEEEDPDWNVFKLHKAWKTAKESLKRRAELGRKIVNSAFSHENPMPAKQIAAEAALLDIPDVFETKKIFTGDLNYPTVEYDVALSATAAGTSYAAADHAVQKVIYSKAPTEKHQVSVFEEQVKESKLTGSVKQLAEEGAKAIVLLKQKHVWEAAKRRIGIHPVEIEKAPKATA